MYELNIDEFRDAANKHIDGLWDIFSAMPSKGDKEADCQRLCLINAVCNLQQAVDGTISNDLIEDEDIEEEQRRDEKNGLYSDKVDIAN